MQSTSALYRSIVSGEHWFESRLILNGVTYGEDSLISMKVSSSMFDSAQPILGKALAATLEVKMLNPTVTVPRMAVAEPQFRACNDEDESEWLSKGVYWIDTRSVTKNTGGNEVLSFTAYDAMLRAEMPFPSTTHAWPASDTTVVSDIATALGVNIDSRTTTAMTLAYQLPAITDMTCREALELIAAYYGGNFVFSDTGELLLVQIGALLRETNYLIRTDSTIVEYITIDGDRILLEEGGIV